MTDGVSPEEWVALNKLLENPAPPPGWLLAAVQSKGETVKDEDYEELLARRRDEAIVSEYIASLPYRSSDEGPNPRHFTVTFWCALGRPPSVAVGESYRGYNEGNILASLAAAVRAIQRGEV